MVAEGCVRMFVLRPLSLSKTKWSAAIWDMNVEGSQWGSLGANAMEQALALVRRIPEQLPNLIASVRDPGPPTPPASQRSACRSCCRSDAVSRFCLWKTSRDDGHPTHSISAPQASSS